ncbi:LysR family transcriptional regulator [Oceanococcus atlanticus]|uniref:LysR family transcriptional regulator n=1 Tax=Oceanococcus atlanticus TaxID=1317117 RepID=A0A1Y1SEW9_9GAMM|nr:LysR family transcriptional regulator [Oceanococcus atlanticus]ORE87244.1 LysR family transcriptional regulator [Oceanococcus atlanticus]RZO87000.1 MAG: LysR family transcriptional regulator [Oceanococcus sp.]
MANPRFDLNLLRNLDMLLRERSVTGAAQQLELSQPAMSNSLRRLRQLFGDPLLVRTSEGMVPTERALALQPVIREVLATVERAVQPQTEFDPARSDRVFRIMASDYAESSLLPHVLRRLRVEGPQVTLDIMTPSDVSFPDVEQGKVDMVINRFDSLPQSLHQKVLWSDRFACLCSRDNPINAAFNLDNYLAAKHVWVSKTGMGIGVGMNPANVQRLGWVDEALTRINKKRQISVFTRHYQAAMLLAQQSDLIATLPTRAASLEAHNPLIAVHAPPFDIPLIELTMAWSPLLQHNPAHQWMRRLIIDVADRSSSAFEV